MKMRIVESREELNMKNLRKQKTMKMNAKLKGVSVVAAALATLGAQEARAIPLIPGLSVPPTTELGPTSALLATHVDGFSTGGGLGLMTGTVTTRVYAADLAYNPLGGLTFTYVVNILTAVGSHTLQSLSLIDWSGVLADGGQTAVGAQADSVSLDVSGTIHWNANPPGGTSTFSSGPSATFILKSDANSFKDSFFSVQDGLADNGTSLAPSNIGHPPVPDGSLTVALLGIGLLGLGVFRRTVSA